MQDEAGKLRYLATIIKRDLTVSQVAKWFGFTYGDRNHTTDRYPCPKCNEESTSKKTLAILDDNRAWYCYHCQEGGDVINWLAARLQVRKGSAISALADRLGISADPKSILAYIRSELASTTNKELSEYAQRRQAVRLIRREYHSLSQLFKRAHFDETDKQAQVRWLAHFVAMERAALFGAGHWQHQVDQAKSIASAANRTPQCTFYHNDPPEPNIDFDYRAMQKFANRVALSETEPDDLDDMTHTWLASKGISRATIANFQVGVLSSARWSIDKLKAIPLIESGVLRDGEWPYRCNLANRIIFPIKDLDHRVIAFAGRAIDEGQQPKYLNTKNSAVFQKSFALYGIEEAAPFIQRTGMVRIVEGYTDVLAAHHHGYRDTVGTMGTALSDDHASILSRLGATVAVLYFDPDPAGRKAATKAVETLAPMTVLDAELPTDPDEALKADPEAFRIAADFAKANHLNRTQPSLEGLERRSRPAKAR